MSIPGDADKEIYILREELTKAEDKLKRVEGALIETDLMIHNVMKRLLTANDVKGDRAMRVNILEQMNDLRRNIIGFFISAGINVDNVKH